MIKKNIRSDREQWLLALAETGTWKNVRELGKPRKHNQGRLKNLEGEIVSSEERVEAMAEYLEKVQWKVNTTEENVNNLRSRAPCLTSDKIDSSHFNMQDITVQEVVDASKTMKNMKSDKPSKIPNEAWKLIVQDCDVAQSSQIFSVRASKMLSCQNNGIKQ